MAAATSTVELLDFVRRSGVVAADQLNRFVAGQPNLPTDPTQSANLLVQKKILTAFQAKLLLAGRYKGFRLGAYLLQDQLGQGGMGAVYLAVHETLRRKAAIKVLPPGGNKLSVERFLREARAAAALDHPNIVRTHDVGRDGDIHFLVMEYVEGQTLDRLLTASGPLSTQRAVEYIAQAATGLQHAYEKGFIHRDIKPSNLILSKDGTVKILDMGLARSFEKDDQLTALLDHDAVVGTADYISPEQAMNDPSVDIRTDIYSLGATFFAILTGRPPFDGPTASKLIQHQMKAPPSLSQLDKTIPKVLAQVVAKMLMKKPEDRYQTPADVILALQPWLSDTPSLMAGLAQTRASSGQLSSQQLNLARQGRTNRKKPNWIWALAGGIAALLLLGAGVAIAVVLSGRGEKDQSQATSPPTVLTAAPTTPATRPDPAAPPVFSFEAGQVAPFRAVLEMKTVLEGQLATFPKSVWPISYKEGSKVAIERFVHRDKPAISLANLNENNDLNSAQIGIQLEPDLISLATGGKYVITVEYATIGTGSGAVCLQTLDYKNLSTQPLVDSGGQWKTVLLPFQREANQPIRITVDSHATGSANSLIFGKISVTKVGLATANPGAVGASLSKLNWNGAKPITIQKRTLDDTRDPRKKINTLISSTGDGPFPKGWNLWPWNSDTLAEAVVDQSQGDWAIGVRNAEGPPTTMLFAPTFTSPTGYCRLRCELLYTGKKFGAAIRICPDNDKASDVLKIDPKADWRSIDVVVDCRTLGRVKFEFHNSAKPDEFLWLRKYEVLEATQDEYLKK